MLAEFWHYFAENRGALIGLVVFVLLVLTAIFAPARRAAQPDRRPTPTPSWCRRAGRSGGRVEFLLGTDAIGRDILSRLIFGSRLSLFVGIVVVAVSLTSGIVIGLVAGYFRGWVDIVIMRLMDIILAFPSLLLALVLVAVLGPGLTNAMIAIALVYQPHFVRLTRASVHVGEDARTTSSRRASPAPGRSG